MKKELSNASQGDRRRQFADLTLMEDPIEFIAEDHLRIRAICEAIDHVAAAPSVKQKHLSETIADLSGALPLLLNDEYEDLYAMLRRRCVADDEIEKTLDRVKGDQGKAAAAIPALLEMLESASDESRQFRAGERAVLARFAADLRKYVIVENAIILPLARFRLTANDRVELRARMIERQSTKGQS